MKMSLIQHLQQWKAEVRPKVLKTILNLTKNYNKLIKYQKERLNAVLESKKISPGKEKGYKKIIDEILETNKIFTIISINT